MDAGFWKSRRVFLTGHTGFKGSWLALWLRMLGAELFGYSLEPPTDPSLWQLLRLEGEFASQRGDVRDLESLQEAVGRFEPEVVIHMAAQPLVRHSYQDPVETYAVNVLGTVHLLEAVRMTPSVRAAVVVTSDKCYENQERAEAYREHEAMGGHDPYSSSKGCAELVTSAYRRSFFPANRTVGHQVAVASARAGNVIGGGDWAPDRLVPDIMRAWEKNQAVVIRHPDAVRPWQHVLEPLSGYLLLAERLYNDGAEYAESWNFGPAAEDARTVRFVLTELARLWNGSGRAEAGTASGKDAARWEIDAGAKVHEAHLLMLDSAKAIERLGWTPRWKLEKALAETVEWYRAHHRGEGLRSRSERQIEEYMEPARVATAPDGRA